MPPARERPGAKGSSYLGVPTRANAGSRRDGGRYDRGVTDAPPNVLAQRYKLTRESFLITRADPPPGVGRFLAFIRSPSGAKVITASGAIPR